MVTPLTIQVPGVVESIHIKTPFKNPLFGKESTAVVTPSTSPKEGGKEKSPSGGGQLQSPKMDDYRDFGKLIFNDTSDATEHVYLFQSLIDVKKITDEDEIKARFACTLRGVPWHGIRKQTRMSHG